jgi:hypothetical protein
MKIERVGQQVGKVSKRRGGMRWLAIGIGALSLLVGTPGLQAEVILHSRGPFTPAEGGGIWLLGGTADSAHRQIAVGLTLGSTSMTFDSMTAWIANESGTETTALIGGIYTALDDHPGALYASFAPVNLAPNLLTSAPITLAANTTYWFLIDSATVSDPTDRLGWYEPSSPPGPFPFPEDYEPVATPPVTYLNTRTSQDSGATWTHLAVGNVAFSISATATPVPEPSTYALAIVGLLGGVILLRRRCA